MISNKTSRNVFPTVVCISEPNVRVQQNALISTLKDRSGLARILLQRLVALVRRAALSVSSYGG